MQKLKADDLDPLHADGSVTPKARQGAQGARELLELLREEERKLRASLDAVCESAWIGGGRDWESPDTPGKTESVKHDWSLILVRLLASCGDQLSRAQDRVEEEAYLATAERRRGRRRLARSLGSILEAVLRHQAEMNLLVGRLATTLHTVEESLDD